MELDCVIEQTVGNCPAGSIEIVSVVVSSERFTILARICVDLPVQLFVVSALDISPVVLVEVGQPVVHVDRALPIAGDVEVSITDAGVVGIPINVTDFSAARLGWIVCTVALRVVLDQLVHLVGEVHQADPDGNKGDPNDEEGWQDSPGRQYWLPGGELLLFKFRIFWLIGVLRP